MNIKLLTFAIIFNSCISYAQSQTTEAPTYINGIPYVVTESVNGIPRSTDDGLVNGIPRTDNESVNGIPSTIEDSVSTRKSSVMKGR